MPFWLVALVLMAASTVLSGLLQKLPKAKASSLGEMQAPTAEEGRNIPVIFGTCLLRAPNVVWYGDFSTQAIKKSAGWLSFGRSQTIGYKYYLGMDLHLCHGEVDALIDICAGVGEDLVPVKFARYGLENGSQVLQINDANLFGGDEKEGGISGPAAFSFGHQGQGSDSYMTGKIGKAYPAYRGISHLVLRRCYLGTSQYIRNLGVVLRRCPSNLALLQEQSNIAGDANPAEIIYEVLRNSVWGLGFPETRFDKASFQAAGEALAAEGMGMSIQVSSPEQADSLIETVLQHIDGVCYTDPATGLWTLKLVREVDHSTLSEFGADDIIECEIRRSSWDDTVNEIKVKYTDRTKWKESIVQVQETANRATRGETVVNQIDFLGFSNAETAQRAATRELRQASYPLAQGRVKVNRKAWAWRMGTAFLLTWPPLGISKMPVRVVGINYGSLENGEIEADIVEDVFGVSYTVYSTPPDSEWESPLGDPQPLIAQLAQEAPYQVIGAAERGVLCAPVRGDSVSYSYDVWTKDAEGVTTTPICTNTIETFCPFGVLASPYPSDTDARDEIGFTLASPVDITLPQNLYMADEHSFMLGDNLIVITNMDGTEYEWMAFRAITWNGDETYTVFDIMRGIYDTVPIDHEAGARVYFVRTFGVFNCDLSRDSPYPSDRLLSIKMLPPGAETIDIYGPVGWCDVELKNRAAKPYPPGNVRVNGFRWPGGMVFSAVMLTWQHRNRTALEGLRIVTQDVAMSDPPYVPEGSYTVEVLVNGYVRRTEADILGVMWGYAPTMMAEDAIVASDNVSLRITPVNGELRGTARTTQSFFIAP